MSLGELAAYIDSHLQERGIDVVLSGGGCVAIYSDHIYISKDLDFIAQYSLDRTKINSAMNDLGFEQKDRIFHHVQSPYFVEFLPGPPSVGQEPIEEILKVNLETGVIRIISPTDSVKDRLAAFYNWGDRQCLEQAVLISKARTIDLAKVQSWSEREGKLTEFEEFLTHLPDS
jgi:hypothetical protein